MLVNSRFRFVAGDEILEINGVEVRNKSVDDVVELMASVNGTVTFLIVPGQETANGGVSEKVVSDLPSLHKYL